MDLPMVGLSNVSLSGSGAFWSYEESSVDPIRITGTSQITFYGVDRQDENILNLSSLSNEVCVELPYYDGEVLINPINSSGPGETSFSFPCFPVTSDIDYYTLTNPTSCSSTDGTIRLRGNQYITEIGLYGITTPIIIVTGPNWVVEAPYNNLTVGRYRVSVAFGVGQSCTHELGYIDLISPALEFADIYTISSCPNTPNGEVIVVISYSDEADIVVTSNAQSTVTQLNSGDYEYEIKFVDVSAGSFCFQIEDVNSSCILDQCIDVEEFDATLLDQLNPSITDDCKGQGVGSINFTLTAEQRRKYSFSWSDGVTGPFRPNLDGGFYTVTITSECGETATNTYYVPSLTIESRIDIARNCALQNEPFILNAVPLGGVPPYTIEWENGTSALSRPVTESGTYSVRITDATGCYVEKEVDVIVPTVNVESTTLCGNSIIGSIAINGEFKSGTEDVQILLNDLSIPVNISDNSYFGTLEGIDPGTYSLYIIIGTCLYQEDITIEDVPTTTQYVGVDDEGNCEYGQFCDGEELVGARYSIPPRLEADADNGFFRCRADYLCEDEVVGSVGGGMQSMRFFEYQVLLNRASQSGQFSEVYIQQMRDLMPASHACSRFRVCTYDLQIRGNQSWGQPGGNNPCGSPPSCPEGFRVCCQWPASDYNVCPGDIGNIYGNGNTPVEGPPCVFTSMRLSVLLNWLDDLYVDYGVTFPGTSLEGYLASFRGVIPEAANCATVTFCANTFEFISSDLGSIDCSSGPGFDPCIVTPILDSDGAVIGYGGYCRVPCQNPDETDCFTPQFLNFEYPEGGAFFTGGSSNPSSSKIKTPIYSDAGKHIGAHWEIGEHQVYVNNIVEVKEGKYVSSYSELDRLNVSSASSAGSVVSSYENIESTFVISQNDPESYTIEELNSGENLLEFNSVLSPEIVGVSNSHPVISISCVASIDEAPCDGINQVMVYDGSYSSYQIFDGLFLGVQENFIFYLNGNMIFQYDSESGATENYLETQDFNTILDVKKVEDGFLFVVESDESANYKIAYVSHSNVSETEFSGSGSGSGNPFIFKGSEGLWFLGVSVESTTSLYPLLIGESLEVLSSSEELPIEILSSHTFNGVFFYSYEMEPFSSFSPFEGVEIYNTGSNPSSEFTMIELDVLSNRSNDLSESLNVIQDFECDFVTRPNPASSSVTISGKLPENAEISISTLHGQKITNLSVGILDDEVHISSLENLPSGIYIVSISGEEGQCVLQLNKS